MIIYLDITDMAIGGGYHLYGALVHYDSTRRNYTSKDDSPFTKHQLHYIIDAHQAAKFNKDEPGAYKAYSPGNKSQRFETFAHLYCVAVSEWREHFPDGRILLLGNNGAMPRRILDGPTQPQRDRLEAIYQEGENMGWYDHRRNYAATDKICGRWFEELARCGISTPYATITTAPEKDTP